MPARILASSVPIFLMLAAGLSDVVGAECDVQGPQVVAARRAFTLCAPAADDCSYEWYGPGVKGRVRARCVRVSGLRAGTYSYVVVRKRGGAEVDRCNRLVTATESAPVRSRPAGVSTAAEDCGISGPAELGSDGSAQLCGPALGNASYVWTGPGGFRASSSCVLVRAPGTYRLVVRNRRTGYVYRCQRTLGIGRSSEPAVPVRDPLRELRHEGDELRAWGRSRPAYQLAAFASVGGGEPETLRVRQRASLGNCPRDLPFWDRVCTEAAGSAHERELGLDELRAIARCVDARSAYFSWADDLGGLCAALHTGGAAGPRRQVVRQLAALLANTCAAEQGIAAGGREIGVMPETPVAFEGAGTVADLAGRADRLLITHRLNLGNLENLLSAVNRGRGIGPVCE